MLAIGFLVVFAWILFFAFLLFDALRPSPDKVHKLGPIYWTAKHASTTFTGIVDDRPAEQHVYFGVYTIETEIAKVITVQFLLWHLSFGVQR